MKISRFKKSQKILTFFAINFNYREPYQVLIDATFCQAALKNKVVIEDQLKKYFQSQIKLLTTQCIILEAESLGSPLIGATMIVKKFHVHKCGHEGKPVSGPECIKSMTKDSRYIIASQDRNLQASLRKVPGRVLLYLHKATPVLEAPSDASKKYVTKKSKAILSENMEKQIETMKIVQGLPTEEPVKQKSKRPKNPNPLSCKKKKNRPHDGSCFKKEPTLNSKNATTMKPKRKRIKIASHVKELIQSTSS